MGKTSSGNAAKPVVSRSLSRCKHCGSKKIDKGYYTRGWNNWCEQAAGDEGYWCNDCLKVSFIKSLDEYKDQLPKWVTAGDT